MQANQLIELRPRKPPAIDSQTIKKDNFHPNVANPAQDLLSPLLASVYEEAKVSVSTIAANLANIEEDVLIIPLGTSSATPSKYRNGWLMVFHAIPYLFLSS